MTAVAQASQMPSAHASAGHHKPAVAIKITRVETIPLHIPFKVAFEFAAGTRPFLEVLLVRLHTDAGIVGVGETQAWRRQGSSETLGNIARNIKDFFEPHLVGRSPFEIADIMRNLDAALDRALYSKAPISDALYDLQGQALGLPLYQLFGGKVREAIPVCAILSIKKTPEATVENAQAFFDHGFRAFTVKIGIDPAADLANVRALRQHFGAEVVLRVDANAGMDFDGALALLQKLAPYDIDVAEQPISMWDVEGMAELARRLPMPLMADECVATTHDLIDVIKRRAATVMQTKQAKNGGLWHVRQHWTIADAAGMRIYPGNHPSTSIASSAVAHLAATWTGSLIEGPFAAGIGEVGSLATDIAVEPLKVDGHLVKVSDRPGLGVVIDEDKIRHLRADI
jgi:L-alanine-DL-glutamate epimerase-like enolase superfamily enzyme